MQTGSRGAAGGPVAAAPVQMPLFGSQVVPGGQVTFPQAPVARHWPLAASQVVPGGQVSPAVHPLNTQSPKSQVKPGLQSVSTWHSGGTVHWPAWQMSPVGQSVSFTQVPDGDWHFPETHTRPVGQSASLWQPPGTVHTPPTQTIP